MDGLRLHDNIAMGLFTHLSILGSSTSTFFIPFNNKPRVSLYATPLTTDGDASCQISHSTRVTPGISEKNATRLDEADVGDTHAAIAVLSSARTFPETAWCVEFAINSTTA